MGGEDSGDTGLRRPREDSDRVKTVPKVPVAGLKTVSGGQVGSEGPGTRACAAARSRFRRRMYQPSAKKMDKAMRETETAMPALAPSESWSEGGRGARGMSVGVWVGDMVGEVEMVDEGGVEVDGVGDDGDCELLLLSFGSRFGC